MMRKVFFLFIVVILPVYFLLPSNWSGDSAISLVSYDQKVKVVHVVNFDPESDTITNVRVPGETQVQVARGLGTWPLSAVWELGVREGYGGQLLQDTVTGSLGFPSTGWGTDEIPKLAKGGPSAIKAVLGRVETSSIRFRDRLRLALFSLGVSSPARVSIDLAKTSYLRRGTIVGGDDGYIPQDSLPLGLSSIFSRPSVSKEQAQLRLVNGSGERSSAAKLATIASVLGAKIGTIEETDLEDFDCRVISKETSSTAHALAEVLTCKIIEGQEKEVILQIGKRFSGRF